MKKLLAIMVMSLLVTTPASAAVQMFLKIDGIEGESFDKAHAGEIDVSDFSFIVYDAGSAAACTAGVQITKLLDKASALLTQAAVDKTDLGGGPAVLVVRTVNSSPLEILKLTMEGVKVANYQISVNSAQDRPTELVTFSFNTMKGEYTPLNKDGSAGAIREYFITPSICPENVFLNGFEK